MPLKNTKGEPSWSLTIAITAFLVSTIVMVFTHIDSIGPVSFKAVNATALTGYLSACLGIYGWRRQTEAKTTKRKKR